MNSHCPHCREDYSRRVQIIVIEQYVRRARKTTEENIRHYAIERARYWLRSLGDLSAIEEMELEDVLDFLAESETIPADAAR